MGALLVLLGFVLPSMTVSCSMLPSIGHSMSLAALAGLPNFNGLLLYLVPLGALATLILTLLPPASGVQRLVFYLGQLAGIALGLLSILLTILPWVGDAGSLGVDVSPAFGMLVLVTGYALTGAGLVLQLPGLRSAYYEATYGAAAPPAPQAGYAPAWQAEPAAPGYPPASAPAWQPPALKQPALRGVSGALSGALIPLQGEVITIGRSSQNIIAIPDPTVSRQHARLCFGRGAWFLQDQGSRAGTFLNGIPIVAQRLKNGDQIQIGECLFIFEC
jgi:hypothetical protein